jgi:hypothetical protein
MSERATYTRDDFSVNEWAALQRIPDEPTPFRDLGLSWEMVDTLMHKSAVGYSSGGKVWLLQHMRAILADTAAEQPDADAVGDGTMLALSNSPYLTDDEKRILSYGVGGFTSYEEQLGLFATIAAQREQIAQLQAALRDIADGDKMDRPSGVWGSDQEMARRWESRACLLAGIAAAALRDHAGAGEGDSPISILRPANESKPLH